MLFRVKRKEPKIVTKFTNQYLWWYMGVLVPTRAGLGATVAAIRTASFSISFMCSVEKRLRNGSAYTFSRRPYVKTKLTAAGVGTVAAFRPAELLAVICETCVFYSQGLWLIRLHVCPHMLKRWCGFNPLWHILHSNTGCGHFECPTGISVPPTMHYTLFLVLTTCFVAFFSHYPSTFKPDS